MTAEQIKLIRLYLGFTQKQFAEHIGLAEGMIAKIERGFAGVSYTTKAKVHRVFDVRDSDFIEFCERMVISS